MAGFDLTFFAHWLQALPLKKLLLLCACISLTLGLSGCAALAVSLVGAGAGAGLSHQVNGTATRTFSEPLPKVKKATLMAAKRMNFQFDSTDTNDSGQVMKGRVSDLAMDVELEVLSSAVTRVSVSARKNLLLMDGATAQEVVVQIERALANIELADAPEVKQDVRDQNKGEVRGARYDTSSDNSRTSKSRVKPKNSGSI